MITIVAVADTHGYHADLQVPDGDILIHAGDLTRRGTFKELAQALEFFRGLPHREKIVIAGNHEFCLQQEPERCRPLLAGFHYLLDQGVTLHGLRFWGSPWQPFFYDWAFNLPRGRPLAERWAQIPDGTDVLVTHGPPLDHGDIVRREHVGCEDLLARVTALRPMLHLYGHIHEDRGYWRLGGSLLANVTTDECERPPTVFEVDEVRREVVSVRS